MVIFRRKTSFELNIISENRSDQLFLESHRPAEAGKQWHGDECNAVIPRAFSVVFFKMATNFKEAVRKVPRPSKLWNPFGFSVLPRRFPRQRRGSKRQPIVPLKEWKIIRGDTVSNNLQDLD